MDIRIAGLGSALVLMQQGWPSHVISMVEVDVPAPEPGQCRPQHLELALDDIDLDGAPDLALGRDVARIVAFAHLLPPNARLLVHCHAGISRSPAAVIAVLVARGIKPVDAVAHAGCLRPAMSPSPAILAALDTQLGLGSETSRAALDWVAEARLRNH